MKTLTQFIDEANTSLSHNYTYEEYCSDLDLIIESINANGLNEGFSSILKKVKSEIIELVNFVKDQMGTVGSELKLSVSEIIKAFKSKSIFEALKHFGFSIRNMYRAVHAATSIINNTLIKAFADLRKLETIRNIDERIKKVDEFLNKYPILKKLTGPAIAGLLVLIWLNMSFVGNFDYDMDITPWFQALSGNFSIHELFASPEGMAMIAFLATGLLSGGSLSVAWAGKTVYNLSLSLIYVAISKTNINKAKLDKIKQVILRKKK